MSVAIDYIIGFSIAAFIGWAIILFLLNVYEQRRPGDVKRFDELHQKEIANASYKLAGQAGIICGIIWAIQHWIKNSN